MPFVDSFIHANFLARTFSFSLVPYVSLRSILLFCMSEKFTFLQNTAGYPITISIAV